MSILFSLIILDERREGEGGGREDWFTCSKLPLLPEWSGGGAGVVNGLLEDMLYLGGRDDDDDDDDDEDAEKLIELKLLLSTLLPNVICLLSIFLFSAINLLWSRVIC